jgi:hypothetical protein
MLDAEQDPGSGHTDHFEGDAGSEKRQYTVKGIDVDAISMMRDAARKDGMKIGAWVSARMKEAAFRSLNQHPMPNVTGLNTLPDVEELDLKRLVYDLYCNRLEAEAKLQSIQAELHEITSSQRTIMAKMLQMIK